MFATIDTDHIADALRNDYVFAKRAERSSRKLGLSHLAAMHGSHAAAIDGAARKVADAIRLYEPRFDRGDFVRRVRDFAAIDNAD